MRATKYSYSIHGNIVAIVDALEADTISLATAVEDVVAEISDKEKLDSRVYCWVYYNDEVHCWDGFSPCTHTFFDIAYKIEPEALQDLPTRETKIAKELEEVLILPAIKQKAHFLGHNPMIMLEKAYRLTAQQAETPQAFFNISDSRKDILKGEAGSLGYQYANKEITASDVYNNISKFVESANELAFIVIFINKVVLPTAIEARQAVKQELNRQSQQN